MGNNPPLSRQPVTAPTGSPDDVLAPGVPGGFPGNQKDDDPEAIDDYFEAAESGPQEYMGVIPPVMELPSVTRLVTAWYALAANLDATGRIRATQILVPDPNRKRILLSMLSVVGSGFLLLGDQPFSVLDNATLDSLSSGQFVVFATALANGSPFVIEEHTGALFAACSNSAMAPTLGVMSVTC